MKIEIRETDAETIVSVSKLIPELINPHPVEEYHHRLQGKLCLLLTAYVDGKPAGFKAGYDKFNDGSFYSWMGGVLPAYRKNHIAKMLLEVQENWARNNGFTSIVFKTRNRHRNMLMFALSNGFSIIDVDQQETLDEYRITLKKSL
jgi:GNAT superfamily N-acetyltransferase